MNVTRYPKFKPIWMVMGLSVWAGCNGPHESREPAAGRRAEAASRVLLDTDINAVLPVAERVFQEYFRVDNRASSAYEWVSQPTEITGKKAQPQRVRDVLTATPNRRRQLARLWLTQKGPHTVIYCQVHTERLDTAERAAFSRFRTDDRPSDTPIDREGSTSVGAREEWVSTGRDRKTETLILDAVTRDLTSTQPGR